VKCYICDKELSEKEIIYNEEASAFEPCTTCLDVIYDTAYCGGFAIDPDDIDIVDVDYDQNDVPFIDKIWRTFNIEDESS